MPRKHTHRVVLPHCYQYIQAQFESLDAAYCFLFKQHLPITIKVLIRMTHSILSSSKDNTDEAATFGLAELEQLYSIRPSSFSFTKLMTRTDENFIVDPSNVINPVVHRSFDETKLNVLGRTSSSNASQQHNQDATNGQSSSAVVQQTKGAHDVPNGTELDSVYENIVVALVPSGAAKSRTRVRCKRFHTELINLSQTVIEQHGSKSNCSETSEVTADISDSREVDDSMYLEALPERASLPFSVNNDNNASHDDCLNDLFSARIQNEWGDADDEQFIVSTVKQKPTETTQLQSPLPLGATIATHHHVDYASGISFDLLNQSAEADTGVLMDTSDATLLQLLDKIEYTSTNPNVPRVTNSNAPQETKKALQKTNLFSKATYDNAEEYLRTHMPLYINQIAHVEHFHSRTAQFGNLQSTLHNDVWEALYRKRITRFFCHQVQGIDAALQGRHVIISTSTSSGKSMVYNIPIFNMLTSSPDDAVALYLFPTKALAQDQLRAILEFCECGNLSRNIRASCLDGDTPHTDRREIAASANIILANPDVIHVSVLPAHSTWKRLLSKLRYVVVDEAHTYKGVFGAHVAFVLRRLVRLCNMYGTSPQFVCCSATIANPLAHFMSLVPTSLPDDLSHRIRAFHDKLYSDQRDATHSEQVSGIPFSPVFRQSTSSGKLHINDGLRSEIAQYVALVSDDTSGAGRRKFVVWNPPLLEDVQRLRIAREVMLRSIANSSEYTASQAQDIRDLLQRRTESSQQPAKVFDTCCTSETALIDTETSQCFVPCTNKFYQYGQTRFTSRQAARGQARRATIHHSDNHQINPVLNVSHSDAKNQRIQDNPHIHFEDEDALIGRTTGGVLNQPCIRQNRKRAAKMLNNAKIDSDQHQLESTHDESASGAVKVRNVSTMPATVCEHETNLQSQDDLTAGSMVYTSADWHEKLAEKRDREYPARKSPIVETAQVIATLVAGGLKTIAFARIRHVAELLLQYTHQRLFKIAPDRVSAVKAYRGGYLKHHRREIEHEMFSGRLGGIIATSALELGVDIGSLDAVVLLGYPGSAASLWQQAGRAGRGGRDAVIVLVTHDSPVDQYFARDPQTMLHRPPEEALVDIRNASVMRQHVMCSAAEHPISAQDVKYFGKELGSCVADLRKKQLLVRVTDRNEDPLTHSSINTIQCTSSQNSGKSLRSWCPAAWADRPASHVSLRSIDDVVFQVIDVSNGSICVDNVEESRAYFEIYQGAIYMNQGVTYKVNHLDLEEHKAFITVSKELYYTRPRDLTNVQSRTRIASSLYGRTHFGRVQVTTTVFGYNKIWKTTGRIFDQREVNLPPVQYSSFGFWTDITLRTKNLLDAHKLDFLGGCHAAAHAVINIMPMFITCDRGDLDTECPSPLQTRARPLRFIIFDARPGGIGVSAAAFRRAKEIYQAALDLIRSCPCKEGCPACVHDLRCSEYNYVIDKQAAEIMLIEAITGETHYPSVGGAQPSESAVDHSGNSPNSVKNQRNYKQRKRLWGGAQCVSDLVQPS